jgi:hypothetical protein
MLVRYVIVTNEHPQQRHISQIWITRSSSYRHRHARHRLPSTLDKGESPFFLLSFVLAEPASLSSLAHPVAPPSACPLPSMPPSRHAALLARPCPSLVYISS